MSYLLRWNKGWVNVCRRETEEGSRTGSAHSTARFCPSQELRMLCTDERIDLKMRTPAKCYPCPNKIPLFSLVDISSKKLSSLLLHLGFYQQNIYRSWFLFLFIGICTIAWNLSLGLQSLKYLLFGPLEKNFAELCAGTWALEWSADSVWSNMVPVMSKKVTFKGQVRSLGTKRLKGWMSVLLICKRGIIAPLQPPGLMWKQTRRRLWGGTLKSDTRLAKHVVL